MDAQSKLPMRAETLDDVSQLERRLVELLLAMRSIDTETEKLCAPILKKAGRQIRPLKREALTIAREIDAFARANKRALTKNGKKVTVQIPNGGQLRWRKSKPAVKMDDEDAVLSFLMHRSTTYEDFIRRTPSVNKTAMAEHPIRASRIPGVHIEPNRKFIIAPKGVSERIERPTTSKKLEIVTPRSRS